MAGDKPGDKPELVIAGNYEQFRHWARTRGRNPRDFIYVSGPESVRGIRGAILWRVGTWYAQPDYAYAVAQMAADEVRDEHECRGQESNLHGGNPAGFKPAASTNFANPAEKPTAFLTLGLYREDVVAFIRDALQVELEPWQEKILNARLRPIGDAVRASS